MAQLLTVSWKDVNGTGAKNQFWCNDALTAAQALQSLANLSNAQIVGAFLSQPMVLNWTGRKTIAAVANVETIFTKVKVRMSGADAGSVAKPRDTTILSIPAPIGNLIDGQRGSNDDIRLTPFIPLIQSAADVAMDRIDRVFYSRSR